MKKSILLLMIIFITAALVIGGIFVYKVYQGKPMENIITEQYYDITGKEAKVYGDTLVVYDGNLKIINLSTKTLIKQVEIPGKNVLGFDIYEGKLVWADLRNEKDQNKIKDLMEKANSDIFMYDMNTEETYQITTSVEAQCNPTIWGSYVAWQDNRNDELQDGYPQWNIYLYNTDSKVEKRITQSRGIHNNCKLYNNYLVWEDGRNFSGMQKFRWKYDMPINNTDIYVYYIDVERYQSLGHNSYQECRPDIYGSNIVWEDRNNKKKSADIKIYNMDSMEERCISMDRFNQIKPSISEDVVVWIDEARGKEVFDGIQRHKNGNSDIGIYDMKTGKEFIIEEEGIQTDCSVTPTYIVYTTKNDENSSKIKVIKYHRELK